jgi:hypothetical protein
MKFHNKRKQFQKEKEIFKKAVNRIWSGTLSRIVR